MIKIMQFLCPSTLDMPDIHHRCTLVCLMGITTLSSLHILFNSSLPLVLVRILGHTHNQEDALLLLLSTANTDE